MQASMITDRLPRRGLRPGAGFLLAAFAGGSPVWAQCQPAWTALNQNRMPFAVGTHDDDGPGPIPSALYVGEITVSVGNATSYNIGRYDGSHWYTVGNGLEEVTKTQIVHTYLSRYDPFLPHL